MNSYASHWHFETSGLNYTISSAVSLQKIHKNKETWYQGMPYIIVLMYSITLYRHTLILVYTYYAFKCVVFMITNEKKSQGNNRKDHIAMEHKANKNIK